MNAWGLPGLCEVQGRILHIAYNDPRLRQRNPRYVTDLTRVGVVLTHGATALHAIDCARWRLAGLTLRAQTGDISLDSVWARQFDAQRQEVIDWISIQTGLGREQVRVEMERFGYPNWWGLHGTWPGPDRRTNLDGQPQWVVQQARQGAAGPASPGVQSGAPAPAGPGAGSGNDDNNPKGE